MDENMEKEAAGKETIREHPGRASREDMPPHHICGAMQRESQIKEAEETAAAAGTPRPNPGLGPAAAKLGRVRDSLNSMFIERDGAIGMIMLAIISKKHSILIGEPGLAKTAVLKSLVGHIEGLRLFDFQMTPGTGIEELMSDNGGGKGGKTGIDNCDIALIDEFFKGPGTTLNSLLAIMNERIIYAPEPRPIPLISLFATSNERPDKSSNAVLLPLYDRFLFRMEILPVKGEENFKKLLELKDEPVPITAFLGKNDINLLISGSEDIRISGDIFDSLYRIRQELRNKQVMVSDRRWREILRVIKASALLKGRDCAVADDIAAIEPSLWTYYSDIRAVKNILGKEMSSLHAIREHASRDVSCAPQAARQTIRGHVSRGEGLPSHSGANLIEL